jgi:hypothetical protein
LAILLPGLFWDQSPATAPALKHAGIERIYVPPESTAGWREAGFTVVALSAEQLRGYEKLEAPGVQWRANIASATRSPWVDANGWRFVRKPKAAYFYELAAGGARLAAAEAFAYGVEAVLHIDPRDLAAFGGMLAFLKQVEAAPMPELANIGVIDDGSDLLGEVLNMLARRNLLFRMVAKPDPRCDLTIRLGSREYPKESAEDPVRFAAKVRQDLTDEKRLLRIYGSEVVLARLTGEGGRARLHLLNYGQRRVFGLRVRLRGAYAQGTLRAAGIEDAALTDYATEDQATEFTIPALEVYAVVDLEKGK